MVIRREKKGRVNQLSGYYGEEVLATPLTSIN